jgi:hypothetical protein
MVARQAAAIAAALVAATVLSACGAPGEAGATDTALQPIAIMPMAGSLATAVMHTRGLATADVTITRQITVAGVERELTGVGGIDTRRGLGNILWTAEDGASVREIVNNIAIFIQSDVPSGRWTRLPEGEVTSTTKLADPLAGLGSMDGLLEGGQEILDGLRTTKYTGQLPTDPAALAALGLSEPQIAGIDDAWQGASTDITAWVDDSDRIVRVDRSFEVTTPGGTITAVRVSTLLSDFSGDIDILSPPSASVTSRPAGS